MLLSDWCELSSSLLYPRPLSACLRLRRAINRCLTVLWSCGVLITYIIKFLFSPIYCLMQIIIFRQLEKLRKAEENDSSPTIKTAVVRIFHNSSPLSPGHVTYGILVPWARDWTRPMQVEVQSSDHWTAGQTLHICSLFLLVPLRRCLYINILFKECPDRDTLHSRKVTFLHITDHTIFGSQFM